MQNCRRRSDDFGMSSEPVLEWSERIAVGWPEIDREHRELIRLIAELAAMHRRGAEMSDLYDVFKRLRDYTMYHFRTEAALMRRHAVATAHATLHLHAHAGFVACLDRAGKLIESRPDDVARNLLAFLTQWLVHHITGVDAELARLLAAATGARLTSPPANSDADEALRQQLVQTVSGLYESIGERTFELLELNHQLSHEIERRERIETALRRSEARFAALYKYAPVALWELDWGRVLARPDVPRTDADLLGAARDITLLDVNQAGLQQAGCATLDELRERGPERVFDGSALPVFAQTLAALLQGRASFEAEIGFTRADGSRRRLAASLFVVPGAAARLDRVIAATLDITDIKNAEARMRHMAMHDSLTDLPNRMLLSDRMRQAMRFGQRTGHRLAVVYIDLDRFKPVNDHHGHAIGDLLLRQVANRLQGALRDSDTVARIGGDEFMLLLHDVRDIADARAVAEKVHTALREPYDIDGTRLDISSSMGIALYPDHGTDELTLARHADQAMYVAKQSGRNGIVEWGPGLGDVQP